MDIWVDVDSGTYGNISRIRVLKDVRDEVVELLEDMSDQERGDFAQENGVEPNPVQELLGRIDQAFHDRRVQIADERIPNEEQEVMTEGLIIGLDVAQELVHRVLGDG